MPSENSKHIIPLLNRFKSSYGNPIALVHDMGKAILKAVKTVFPGVPDYICHFHFLRDIGKDLFATEYDSIRRYTRTFKIKPALRKSEKALKIQIDEDQT
jgi:transposase-like protein